MKKTVKKVSNNTIEKKLTKVGATVGKKLDAMSKESLKAKKEAQKKYAKHLKMLEKNMKMTEKKLKKLETQSDEAWNDVQKGAGAAWKELKASFEAAFSEFK